MSKTYLTDSRDIQLLKFLWRWKLATTSGLTKKFFVNCTAKTAYNRLLALKTAGFIRSQADKFQPKYVWVLGRMGFDAIRNTLPALDAEAYRPEHLGHDLLVTAAHLGDWLLEMPKGVEVFTEQELRTYSPDFYPDWVPHPTTRRADGYWRIPIGDSMATIALEVELTLKRNVDYEIIGEFYAHQSDITRTLWITEDLTAAKRIAHNIKVAVGSKPFTHDFVCFTNFKKSMWQSPISIGPEKDKSIASLLQIKKGTCPGTSLAMSLLDTRKCGYKSENYRFFETGDFSD